MDQFRRGLEGNKHYQTLFSADFPANPLCFNSATLTSTAASDRWLESWGAMGDDGDDDYDDGFGDENTQESLGPSWPILAHRPAGQATRISTEEPRAGVSWELFARQRLIVQTFFNI